MVQKNRFKPIGEIMYYIFIEKNKILGAGETIISDVDIINFQISKEVYDDYIKNPDKYIWNGSIVVENPNYEAEQAEKERQRLNLLNLTKADVLLALYQDKGITPDDIKVMLKDNVPALIKFDYASSYYRGDDVVNALGLALGYSTEEMDYLFENKKFPEKPVEPIEPADTDSDNDTDTDLDSDTDNDNNSDSDSDTDKDTSTDVEPEA